MTNYWVFIVKDHIHMGKIIPAREVLANRVSNRFWSLNSKAANLKKLQKGDRVLFYVTELSEKGFMGRGALAGPAHPMTEEQRFHIIGSPSISFDYVVDFEEMEMWPFMITLDQLKDRMPLLLGRKLPARIFRGSIRRITERDYEVVMKVYEKLSQRHQP
ncbi:MAG: EVE domain-containing protein [Nitrososphaerota archaeon]|nr:EVE domain-containing protein [Nitrososphaerota archaeon]